MTDICLTCLTEPYLRTALPTSIQVCDFCSSFGPAVNFFDVIHACDDVLEAHFQPTNFDDAVVVYERAPQGTDVAETLRHLNVVCDDAIDALISDLEFVWFDRDSMEHKYLGWDPDQELYFRPRTDRSANVSAAWERMNRSLQQEARYLNPEASRVLEQVLGAVGGDLTNEGKPVVVQAGPGTEISRLYRARVFQVETHLTEALAHPGKFLGTPAPGIGQAGRMNAKGQPAFYGATTVDIALAEVRPPVGAWVATAAFDLLRPVRLLDIRSLGRIRLDAQTSLFDPASIAQAERRDFLRTLSSQLVQPVMPDLQDRDYLITQVIADFLATRNEPIDGIIYPSVQRPGVDDPAGNGDQAGFNVVLFSRASKVDGADAPSTSIAYLWQEEQGDRWLDPAVHERSRPSQLDEFEDADAARMRSDAKAISPSALVIVKTDIRIHKVTGVVITREETAVEYMVH